MDIVNPVNQVNPPNALRLIACPRLFSIEKDRIDREVPAGGTVADHLRGLGWDPNSRQARVCIDGLPISHAQWEYAVPHARQVLSVRMIPMGGEGKDITRILLQIAIIMAAITVGSYFGPILGPFVTAAITIVGTLALNGLIPSPLPYRALPQPLPQRPLQEAA